MIDKDMTTHFCFANQLWFIVQNKFAKAPKSKALLRALNILPECEENLGKVDSDLRDTLYSGYVSAFPANQLHIDAFMEDKELCFIVSRMVVERLIGH